MLSTKKWLYFSVVSFFVSSATIWLMPMGSFEQESKKPLAYTLAVVFWLGLILGFVFLIQIGKQRKKKIKYGDTKGLMFFRFFRNKFATAFDVLLFTGILIIALSFIFRALPDILMTGGIFLFVFSLEMHGVFNGKNYEFLQRYVR